MTKSEIKAVEERIKSEDEKLSLEDFQVKLPVFEGPFTVLLHLIEEEKIGIHEVSLTQITQGYLKYLSLLRELDLTVASEFLVMAACLIELKSKTLLPKTEKTLWEEEKEKEAERNLAEHLAQYKAYKERAKILKGRQELFQKMYSRHSFDERLAEEIYEPEIFLTDVTLRDLVTAFESIWETVEAREKTEEILDEEITVKDKIEEIIGKIKRKPQGIPLEKFFTRFIKLEVIVTFLAVLELVRQKQIRIKQGEIFGSIIIMGT